MRISLLLGLLAITTAGCLSIRSGLEIEPGASFVLGGDQDGGFRIEVLNTGNATVRVYEITVFRDTSEIATISSGGTAEARFAPGSAALVVNRDSVGASLDVRVTGDTNLGMRYTPTD